MCTFGIALLVCGASAGSGGSKLADELTDLKHFDTQLLRYFGVVIVHSGQLYSLLSSILPKQNHININTNSGVLKHPLLDQKANYFKWSAASLLSRSLHFKYELFTPHLHECLNSE